MTEIDSDHDPEEIWRNIHQQLKFMKSILLLLGLLLVLVTPKMLYMTELFRHGARYPVTDVYDGKETKAMHGNLTSIGMRQQFLLGSYLRRDYIDQLQLVSPTLVPREVEIFTDSSERCYESAYAHAAGLFPLNYGARLPDGISSELLQPPFEGVSASSLTSEAATDFALNKGYQPVPIKHEQAYFPFCLLEGALIAKRIEEIAVQVAQMEVEQTNFAERMRKVFGLPITLANIGGLIELYDVVACDLNLGRPMPEQFTEKDFLELKYVQAYMFVLLYSGDLARVESTPIASSIISKMEKVIAGKFDGKKLTIYSGHDTNVAPMLTFMNLTTADCVRRKYKNETVTGNCAEPVPFASSIQFELHQRDTLEQEQGDLRFASNYFVKVRYNGDYYRLCQSNSLECDFQEFSARVKHQLVDHKKECGII